MTFISIDVSQYRPAVCHATLSEGLWRTADDYAEKREGECPTGLWSALLPEYPNAKLQLSTDNPHSRRGLALPWPPEAQVPVGHKDNWNNGCGRVPLLCSLAAIRQEALGNEWKSIRPKVSWQPHGSEQSYEHAALLALACRREEVTRQCLIVPENFNESAQQALLVTLPDTCRLVPRSMALAVKWCQEHQADYQVQASPSRGLLVCVAMGMDEWELSVVEVCSERENGVLRLVPVHDPTIRGRGLGVCGLSLFPYVLNGKPEERIWRNLQRQGQDMMELLAAPELAQRLQTLRSVIASGLRVPFERLPMMRALVDLCNLI